MERMGETGYVSDRGNWVYCSAWVREGLNDSQRRVGGGKGRYIYRTIRWLMIVGMSG